MIRAGEGVVGAVAGEGTNRQGHEFNAILC